MSHATGYQLPNGGCIELVSRSTRKVPQERMLAFRLSDDMSLEDRDVFYTVLENFRRVQTYTRPIPGENLVSATLNIKEVDEDRLDGFTNQTITDLFAAVRHAFEGPSGNPRNSKSKSSTKGRKPNPVKRDLAKMKK